MLNKTSKGLLSILLPSLALSVTACADSTGPAGNGRVAVFLTDAPADYLEMAEVCVSQVYLQGGEDEEAGRTILWEKGEGDAQCFDLLELQGISVPLTELGVEVPAGIYHQLRLIVESATATLIDPYTFPDGSTEMEMSIPSGAQTGIKVQLKGPIVAEPEVLTEITVDAPVEENFRIQGNPSPPENVINGLSFQPTLKEVEPVE